MTEPEILVSSPLGEDYSYSENLLIDFSVSDFLSGIAGQGSLLDGSGVSDNDLIDLFGFSVGRHEFKVSSSDVAGNYSEEIVLFNVVDAVPPLSSNDYDGLWRNENYFITLNATDEKSNVKEIHFILNNGVEQVVLVSGQAASTRVLIDYEHDDSVLEYWSVDEFGNEEVHQTLNGIKLDKTAPQISLSLNPVKNYYLNDELLPLVHSEIDPRIQGSPSGVSSIEWLIDGVKVSNPEDISGLLGEHVLTGVVVDNAGNQSSELLQFVVALHLTDLFITPETLNINPGVITAHTEWPERLSEAVILSATLDGASMDKIADKNIKFERNVVENYLQSVGELFGTHFNVEGTFEFKGQNFIFYGEDEITEIQS